MADQYKIGFHEYRDIYVHLFGTWAYRQDTEFTYTFENFFHPYVGELIEKLNKQSLRGMLDPQFHQSLSIEFFDSFYTRLASDVVKLNTFPKEIDLREGGPYAVYNWELLFHIPLAIAVHLSKNQRFAEAQRWFHYIFDPTSNDTSVPAPQRYWKFLAFRRDDDPTQIDNLLALLSKTDLTPEEALLRESILSGYEAIKNKPFQPHAVARTRHIAYQYCVVMKYLDNLIAWGDWLFRQDTVESINEATQRYVLAANLLGPKPQQLPQRGGIRPRTFMELRAAGLNELGNALVELEGKFPWNLETTPADGTDPDAPGPLFGIGRTLYFCIPRNDKLLAYWDTVADRLYKIRNCLNIDGVFRQLALFDPPIDPGMLVKAQAAGIDISAVAAGLNHPAGPVRASLLIEKALELCSEVRGLGAALLAAIEKEDGERLAQLRQTHEIRIHEMTQEVRFLQWKEAEARTEALLKSRAGALERYRYYARLLGLPLDSEAAPDTLAPDRRTLTEENFDEVYSSLVEQYDRPIATQNFPETGTMQEGRLHLYPGEYEELNGHADRSLVARISAASTEVITGGLSLIPTMHLKASYWGIGPDARIGGGDPLAAAGRAASSGFNIWAMIEDHLGANAAKKASYERRADEWLLQCNLAARELAAIGRQLIASLIAEQIAYRDYENAKRQIEHAQEVDRFLRDKFSNAELYGWMQGEISRLYYEYYRFAFDIARRAEQTMKQELMRPETDSVDYIRFNYWDGGRKGLLSGEALYLDVKRMELAYHDHNKREYELTKHVSLRRLDPAALLALKATGACEFSLPEWLFDLDAPGHYMRRIKSVSLSLPSVTGPYTSIHCTLTLVRSTLRRSSSLAEGRYARQGSDDSRFLDYYGSTQSIVTSSANNDSGMFETNLRDDRMLPFEGAGVESVWRLELPAGFRQFDYNTISDAVLHLRYRARQGGEPLAAAAVNHLETLVSEASASGLAILLSLPQDYPNEWHRFAAGDDDFTAVVKRDYFPYFTRGRQIAVESVRLYAIHGEELKSAEPPGIDPGALSDQLAEDGLFPLAFAADNDILVRERGTQAFVIVRYSLASV